MVVARVILKEARSYRQGGRRFIKDVPQVIKGASEVVPFIHNGFFHVSVLKGKEELDELLASSAPGKAAKKPEPAKAAKVEDEDDDDEAPARKSGSGLKKKNV